MIWKEYTVKKILWKNGKFYGWNPIPPQISYLEIELKYLILFSVIKHLSNYLEYLKFFCMY